MYTRRVGSGGSWRGCPNFEYNLLPLHIKMCRIKVTYFRISLEKAHIKPAEKYTKIYGNFDNFRDV